MTDDQDAQFDFARRAPKTPLRALPPPPPLPSPQHEAEAQRKVANRERTIESKLRAALAGVDARELHNELSALAGEENRLDRAALARALLALSVASTPRCKQFAAHIFQRFWAHASCLSASLRVCTIALLPFVDSPKECTARVVFDLYRSAGSGSGAVAISRASLAALIAEVLKWTSEWTTSEELAQLASMLAISATRSVAGHEFTLSDFKEWSERQSAEGGLLELIAQQQSRAPPSPPYVSRSPSPTRRAAKQRRTGKSGGGGSPLGSAVNEKEEEGEGGYDDGVTHDSFLDGYAQGLVAATAATQVEAAARAARNVRSGSVGRNTYSSVSIGGGGGDESESDDSVTHSIYGASGAAGVGGGGHLHSLGAMGSTPPLHQVHANRFGSVDIIPNAAAMASPSYTSPGGKFGSAAAGALQSRTADAAQFALPVIERAASPRSRVAVNRHGSISIGGGAQATALSLPSLVPVEAAATAPAVLPPLLSPLAPLYERAASPGSSKVRVNRHGSILISGGGARVAEDPPYAAPPAQLPPPPPPPPPLPEHEASSLHIRERKRSARLARFDPMVQSSPTHLEVRVSLLFFFLYLTSLNAHATWPPVFARL